MTKGFGFTGSLSYIDDMMKDDRKLDGLSVRHVAQIVRRKMITRTKQSKKNYSRKNLKKDLENWGIVRIFTYNKELNKLII